MKPISKNEFMAMTDEEKWQYVEEALRELQERMFEGIEESETEMAECDNLGKAETPKEK